MATQVSFKDVFRQLLWNWVANYGAVTLLVVSAWFLPYVWVPFLGFLLILPVMILGNYNLSNGKLNCSLINYYTFYILILSSVFMLALNLSHTHWFTFWETTTSEFGPFITTLIIFPLATIFYGIGLLRRNRPDYCKACRAQNDLSVRRALECNVFHREVSLQLKLLFWICLSLSLVSWAYYWIFFIDININTPDSFFFYITPLVIFFLSVAYLVARYSNMHFETTFTPRVKEKDVNTRVRYMIIKGDDLMLSEVAHDHGTSLGMWDTPGQVTIPLTENLSETEARELFEKLSGTDSFSLKFLFNTSHQNFNVFHYAAFLDNEEVLTPNLQGTWFNLYEIDMMMKKGLVWRAFAYEMHRVFTMTMAWKTYDENGKRLYPIKKYRPTFRLSDFKDWNLDYSDLRWLGIAKNNEDVPFFKIRKFWRNYVSGADLRWKKRQS